MGPHCLLAYRLLYPQFKRLLLDFTEQFGLCPPCASHSPRHPLHSHPRVFLFPPSWSLKISAPFSWSLSVPEVFPVLYMTFARQTQRNATKGQGGPFISFSEEMHGLDIIAAVRTHQGCPHCLLSSHACYINRLWTSSKLRHLRARSASAVFVCLAAWAGCF